MPATALTLLTGSILIAAAASKLADRPGSAVALSTYGIAARLADPLVALLIAVEASTGAALVAGLPGAAWAAAALLGSFALAQAVALAAGRGGAPCGCLGSGGRLGAWSLGRAAALSVLAGAAASGDPAPWWLAASAAGAALAIGSRRREPAGALDVAGEGPVPGVHSPLADLLPAGGLRLAVFTSEGCRLCRRLRPALDSIAGVEVHVLDEERDAQAWLAARVPGSPYAVLLDADGVVLSKGAVNTATQMRSLLPRPAGLERRGFMAAAGRLAAGVAGAATVGRLVRPGEAEAYHFCGHVYTTDSCPHPTGLPRIDGRGLPLRARDGKPVDDLGRLIDPTGNPVAEDGSLMVDADGRPLPRATRTKVCVATGREFRIPVQTDGAWYRCCGGTVRKLVDCCSTSDVRINGDASLRGYCYGRRKVFCVMYFQTKVPC